MCLNLVIGKNKSLIGISLVEKQDKSNDRRRKRVEKLNECHVGFTCAPTRPARNLGMSV